MLQKQPTLSKVLRWCSVSALRPAYCLTHGQGGVISENSDKYILICHLVQEEIRTDSVEKQYSITVSP